MVSLITVNYNEIDETIAMLKSLGRYDDKHLEIIVIDNGSKLNETNKIKNIFPKIKTIRSEKNLGFAGGNNLGIKESKGSYLFFINNDTIFIDGLKTIFQLKEVLKNNLNAAIVSPLIYFFDHPDTLQYAGFTLPNSYTGRNKNSYYKKKIKVSCRTEITGIPHGAAMMLKKSIIDEVGLMPENYFLYYEEVDWAIQIRKKGYEVLVDHSSRILHKESVSTGKISGLKMYYLTRNRILFMRRNYKKINVFIFFLFFGLISIPIQVYKSIKNNQIDNLPPFFKGIKWNFLNSSH